MREEPKSKAKVVGEYENDVLVIIGEPVEKGQWYPVTVVHDGAQGYMRDFLLTEIPEADAQERMAKILAEKVGTEAAEEILPEETAEDEQDAKDNDVQAEAVQKTEEDENAAGSEEKPVDIVDIFSGIGDLVSGIVPPEAGTEDAEDVQEEQTETPDDGVIDEFPAYAMTLEQENGAVIVLRTSPAGELPQDGAIPVIREPSPLELTEAAQDADGNV